jgi:hypothetical protein
VVRLRGGGGWGYLDTVRLLMSVLPAEVRVIRIRGANMEFTKSDRR